jgi:hypothetical protein
MPTLAFRIEETTITPEPFVSIQHSELVSWFHGDSLAITLFDQGLAPGSRTSGAVSGLLDMPPAGWRLLGAASTSTKDAGRR